MTVKCFVTVIYLWLTFTTLANGQYFSGKPNNFFPPQSQPSANQFTQPHGQQNFFSPGVQSPGFTSNPQATNHHNIPQVSNLRSFTPGISMPELISDLSTLFPPKPIFNPSLPNHSNTPGPQNPTSFDRTFAPQRPSNYGNPQQTNPFYAGGHHPGSTFVNPQKTDSMFRRPQQTSPFSPQPTPLLSTVPQIRNPSTLRYEPNNPGFNGPQHTNPSYINPRDRPYSVPSQARPGYTSPHEVIPLNHQQTRPSYTSPQETTFPVSQQARPTYTSPHERIPSAPQQARPNFISPQHTILPVPQQPRPTFISPQHTIPPAPQQSRPNFFNPQHIIPTVPQQIKPSYIGPQHTIPSTPQETIPSAASPQEAIISSPHQPKPSNISPQETKPLPPQQTNPDQTSSQQTNPDPTSSQDFSVPKQTNSDSTVAQPTDSVSTISKPTNSDSTIPQPTESDSTISQPTDSDSTIPQSSDLISTVPQQTDLVVIAPQQSGSDSTAPKKTDVPLDDSQPLTSGSESSVSNPPQDTSSIPTAPKHKHHSSHNRNTRYRPRLGSHTKAQSIDDPLNGIRIVCIFNNKHYYKHGLTPGKIEPHLCTHLNYEFAILDPKTYEMIIGEPELDIETNFYEEAIGLKRHNSKLKVVISLGGWSDSTKKYSELVADPEKRANFIKKAIEFLINHEFDGLDLAWEYPNCWQGAIGVSPKDKQNFVIFLKEMKPQFKQNNLILSVSVGAIKREVEAAYDVAEISKYVDYINVMTYDMHGPWEPKTSHHVQFDATPDDKDPYCNVKGGMQVWIEKGADKTKLNMGLACYARTFRLANPKQCGMGAPALGAGAPGPISKEGGIMSYHEVCKCLNSGNWTEKEDKYAGYYAYCGDQWAAYDPPMMMVKKAKYVVDSGLGGVLIKDLSGDDFRGQCFNMPFPLVKMVRLEITHKVRQRI